MKRFTRMLDAANDRLAREKDASESALENGLLSDSHVTELTYARKLVEHFTTLVNAVESFSKDYDEQGVALALLRWALPSFTRELLSDADRTGAAAAGERKAASHVADVLVTAINETLGRPQYN